MIVEMWEIEKIVDKQPQPLFGETGLMTVPTEGPFETEAEAQKRIAELGPEYVVRRVSASVEQRTEPGLLTSPRN